MSKYEYDVASLFWGKMFQYTDVDKIVGTLPLKEEKATIVTEIT